MQFTVYRNTGNVKARPYLLNVQSEIIGVLGKEVCSVVNQRDTIKATLDFLFDGI